MMGFVLFVSFSFNFLSFLFPPNERTFTQRDLLSYPPGLTIRGSKLILADRGSLFISGRFELYLRTYPKSKDGDDDKGKQ